MPPSWIEPEVRKSRPARQCIKVDFPDPEGPITAVSCREGKSTVTPSRARTSKSPVPYTFTASVARAAMVTPTASIVATGRVCARDAVSRRAGSPTLEGGRR